MILGTHFKARHCYRLCAFRYARPRLPERARFPSETQPVSLADRGLARPYGQGTEHREVPWLSGATSHPGLGIGGLIPDDTFPEKGHPRRADSRYRGTRSSPQWGVRGRQA